ncbi:hypothetical protein [Pseudarthrobacter chlorophenolicus]|nr:hypothetical protein [Pseudarthrobacter chlorophenolicus]
MAIQLLMDIRDGRISGLSLDESSATGDLSDCYKVYFDPDPEFDNRSEWRFRLVYRLLGDGAVAGLTVEGVAVGRRHGLDAYLRAVANLGR